MLRSLGMALLVGVVEPGLAAQRIELGATLDCAQQPQLRLMLPPVPEGLHVEIPGGVPKGVVLEVREAGQDLDIQGPSPGRAVPTPPRYGTTLYQVSHPLAFDLTRVRSGGRGAVELRLHCVPSEAARLWRWFADASALAAQFGGGVGSLSERFPDAELAAVKDSAFDSGTRALAQHLDAEAKRLAGRVAEASDAYERAASDWHSAREPERASAALVGVAESLLRSGQYDGVLRVTRTPAGTPDGTHYFGARLENARCVALHYLGALDQAASCYAWTSEQFDALDETLELASTGINFASVETARGHPDSAQHLLLDSADLAQGAQSLTVQGRAQFELAGLARDRGDVGEALNRLQRAQDRFSEATERRWEANTLMRLGALLNELRAPGDARASVKLALSMIDTDQAPARAAAAQLLLARIELSDGHPQLGLLQAEAALAGFRELNMPEEVARAEVLITRLLLRADRFDAASGAIAAAPDGNTNVWAEVIARQLIGAELDMHAGQPEKAARVLRALTTNLTWSEQLERTRLLAAADWQSGRHAEAYAYLRARARDLAVLSRSAGNALLAHVLRDSVDTLRQTAIDLIARELDAGTAASEQLLEQLAPWLLEPAYSVSSGAGRSAPSSELDTALSALLLPDTTPGGVATSNDYATHTALLDRLARSGSRSDPVIVETDLTPAALRVLARPGRPLLALLRGRTRLLRLWIEANANPRLDSLDLSATYQPLDSLRPVLARPDGNLAEIDAHARALSALLFAGLGVRPAPERLQVIGDRFATVIPWPLLYWPRDTQPLVDRSVISLLRLTPTVEPHAAAPKQIEVLIADQKGSSSAIVLPALSGATFEPALIQRHSLARRVHAVAAVSREQVLSRLAEPGAWLHLSAHGKTQSDRLVASGIWLDPAMAGQGAQFLSWADILEQGVSADLVVLNACQLAQSDGAAANAALDFATALSRAGAHEIVAAQWPVSDTASTVWVPAFYQSLSDSQPPDPGLALAKARRALRASRAFRHPFHWAGWVHLERVAIELPADNEQ